MFVIGGGGSGVPVYRRLQRQGIAFAAGILAPNDLDYPTAKALAASLVESVTDKPGEINVDTWENWRKKEQ